MTFNLTCYFIILEWTAPSAIGIAGLGGGFEVGAEVNMVLFVNLEEKFICIENNYIF